MNGLAKTGMNLYLIGYRGSGKSTVGAFVAKHLGCPHEDTDLRIEQQAKQSIQQIFADHGEAEFRNMETELIRTFRGNSMQVVSLGGGAVLAAENQDRLRATGKMVWLKAAAEKLAQRIEQDPASSERRPALTSFRGLDEVQRVLTHREPIYAACADFTIEVDEMEPHQVAEVIADWWLSVDRDSIPTQGSN